MAENESAPYSPEQADLVFDLFADGALVTGLRELQGPDLKTVLRWITSDPNLYAAYEVAHCLSGEALLDEMLACVRSATPRTLPAARRAFKALRARYAHGVKEKISPTFKEDTTALPPEIQEAHDLLAEVARLKRMRAGRKSQQISREVHEEVAREESSVEDAPASIPDLAVVSAPRRAKQFAAEEPDYSLHLAQEIGRLLAAGETLSAICRLEGMPSLRMVRRWLRDVDEFRKIHDEARVLAAVELEAEAAREAASACGAFRAQALLWVAGERRTRGGDLGELFKAEEAYVEFQTMLNDLRVSVPRMRAAAAQGGDSSA